jgi:hypothetical protein
MAEHGPFAMECRMEATNVAVEHGEWPDERRVLSECWIYTRERGLKAVTMHGNGSTIALDGRRLYRWHVLDDQQSIVAHVYSADAPSHELREQVTELARERFELHGT